MSTSQRSKSGCWTCRLRRKKCSEDGPPCSKCTGCGILCHGYGPKPAWKDKGDREREEARKLRIQSRRSRARSASSVGEMMIQDLVVASPAQHVRNVGSPGQYVCCHAPIQEDLFLSLPQSRENTTFEDSGNPHPTPAPPPPSLFMDDIWPDSISRDELDDNMTPPSPTSYDKLDMGFISFLPLAKPSHLGIETPETDIHLIIAFIEGIFSRQYSLYQTSSSSQKSWLLYLMLRSPTFYNTSLSMSAYHLHLSESSDTSARELALKNYQKYRESALRGFHGLGSTISSIHGETIICGVHIALLEALGKNMRSCQSYLRQAEQSIIENECVLGQSMVSEPSTTSGIFPPTPDMSPPSPISIPSSMELNATVFFAATFVWNDILHSAVEKKVPSGASIYRRLLSGDGFSSVFKGITGCETWIMTAIMDITLLEIKKDEQLAQGKFSIRELVSQVNKIEEAVEREMARLSGSIVSPRSHDEPSDRNFPHHLNQTIVFGHAILIHLNTVVSGALTGVPEIHQSITRAVPAWNILPSTMNPKYLAWAYSTSASLATGSQRDVFRTFITNLSRLDVDMGSLREFSHGIEECWKETDKPGSDHCNIPCDWREIHKRCNLNILFV